MKKWDVYGRVVGSKFLGTFEAETAEDAIQTALDTNGHVSIGACCSAECEGAEVEDAVAEEVV